MDKNIWYFILGQKFLSYPFYLTQADTRGLYIRPEFLAHLSHSDKVSFCDRSLSVVRRRPLTIDLNDNSS